MTIFNIINAAFLVIGIPIFAMELPAQKLDIYAIASSPEQIELGQAIEQRDQKRVAELLQSKKCDPNKPCMLQMALSSDSYSFPLRIAIQKAIEYSREIEKCAPAFETEKSYINECVEKRDGYLAIADILLNHGADINAQMCAGVPRAFDLYCLRIIKHMRQRTFTYHRHFFFQLPVIVHSLYYDDGAVFGWLIDRGAVVPPSEELTKLEQDLNFKAEINAKAFYLTQQNKRKDALEKNLAGIIPGNKSSGVLGIICDYAEKIV